MQVGGERGKVIDGKKKGEQLLQGKNNEESGFSSAPVILDQDALDRGWPLKSFCV